MVSAKFFGTLPCLLLNSGIQNVPLPKSISFKFVNHTSISPNDALLVRNMNTEILLLLSSET